MWVTICHAQQKLTGTGHSCPNFQHQTQGFLRYFISLGHAASHTNSISHTGFLQEGCTPLWVAAGQGNVNLLTLLLDAGSDVDAGEKVGAVTFSAYT